MESDTTGVEVENFSIHFDIDTSKQGAGQIREEIYDQIDHPAIVKSRTSVVREGPFEHKLGD